MRKKAKKQEQEQEQEQVCSYPGSCCRVARATV